MAIVAEDAAASAIHCAQLVAQKSAGLFALVVSTGVGIGGYLESQNSAAWSKPKRMCHHPELVPTAWNQPRPEPVEMVYSCECGENYCCPVCGWGVGSYPCLCMRTWHRGILGEA